MPRYFFHVWNDQIVQDVEGMELPNLEAAHEQAIEDARAMASHSVKQGHLNRRHRIDVTDEADKVLLSVSFREAVTVQG